MPWCDLIPEETTAEVWVFYDVAKILGLDNGTNARNSYNFGTYNVEGRTANSAAVKTDETTVEEVEAQSHFFADAERARRACYAYAEQGVGTNKDDADKVGADQWVASTAAAYKVSAQYETAEASSAL